MRQPSGLGIWVAFAGQVGGHAAIADVLPALGVSWVAPRGGAGATRDSSWSQELARDAVARYHSAGIAVFPWIYSRPISYRYEIELFRRFIDEGADGVILDAEVSWDRGHRDAATRYMTELDAALPDTFVADAPWAYPSYHPGFPFVEFGRRVNARMPQTYWTEFDRRGPRYHLPRIDAEWAAFHAANAEVARPVCPIGVTYGVEHPSHPPGLFNLDDLEFFLERYADRPAASLYTYEAAVYADRVARRGVLEFLRSRGTAQTSP